MVRLLMSCLTALALIGCQAPAVSPSHTVLTGVIVQKPWSKTMESWNAGGSEYFVLESSTGSTLLRPSKTVTHQDFERFVGQSVHCHGVFVEGEPYVPDESRIEQAPVVTASPFSTEPLTPRRGQGFSVFELERAD